MAPLKDMWVLVGCVVARNHVEASLVVVSMTTSSQLKMGTLKTSMTTSPSLKKEEKQCRQEAMEESP